MKTKELREMSAADLRQTLADTQRELGELRFKHAITRLENPAVLGEKRRVIARIHTLLKEKEA
jgi:large subunit ribosomal protein L29